MKETRKTRYYTAHILSVVTLVLMLNNLVWYLPVLLCIWIFLCPSETLGYFAVIVSGLKLNKLSLKLASIGLAIDKTEPQCLVIKTYTLMQMEKLDLAKEVALQAVDEDKESTAPLHNLWSINYQLENFEEAKEAANKLVELFPDEAIGYFTRAMSSYNLSIKKHQEQIQEDLEKAINIDPNNVDYFKLQSQIYIILNKIDLAVSAAKKANNLRPDDNNKINLAFSYVAKYDLIKAQECLDSVSPDLRLCTNYVFCRAQMFSLQDMFDAALRDIDQIEDPKEPVFIYTKGELYAAKLDISKAFTIAKTLVSEFPEKEFGYRLKASVYNILRRHDEALVQLKNGEEFNDFSGDIQSSKSFTFYCKNDFKSAINEADKALEKSKYCYGAARVKQLSLIKLNNIEEANKWCEFADDIYCNDSLAWASHGHLELARANLSSALEYFSKAISSNPFEPDNYLDRAKIFIELHEREAAEKDLKENQVLEEKIRTEAKLII